MKLTSQLNRQNRSTLDLIFETLDDRLCYNGYVLFHNINSFNISLFLFRNADINEIRNIFPKADLKIIPGASHFVHTDKPQEFQEIVHKFLAG